MDLLSSVLLLKHLRFSYTFNRFYQDNTSGDLLLLAMKTSKPVF